MLFFSFLKLIWILYKGNIREWYQVLIENYQNNTQNLLENAKNVTQTLLENVLNQTQPLEGSGQGLAKNLTALELEIRLY